ncbi:MAG: ClpXP protease specificity-enhancing factor SspB [Archangium sp.]
MSDRRETEKKSRLLESLEQGLTQIHLDARRPGVIVPEQFRGEHHLRLNLSYRFDPPDLSVSDWGVRQTLSFGGSRFTVGLPWSAVYAVASLVTQELWMFPDDMPVELVEAATEKVKMPPEAGEPGTSDDPRGPRAVLREVVSNAPPPESDDAAPKEPPKRGHLRLVK